MPNMSTAPDYDAGEALVRAGDNVVMLRTFSKIYGLAGLRLGWAYCPPGGRRCAEPHPRAVQHLRAGPGRRRWRRSTIAAHEEKSRAHNGSWRAGWQRPADRSRLSRPSQRRQFPAGRVRRCRTRAPIVFLKSRGLILRKMGGLWPGRLPAHHHRQRGGDPRRRPPRWPTTPTGSRGRAGAAAR